MTQGGRQNQRSVWIGEAEYAGVKLIAQIYQQSIAAVIRDAINDKLMRHGLSVVDGEITLNPAVWPAEIREGGGGPGGRRSSGQGSNSTPEALDEGEDEE